MYVPFFGLKQEPFSIAPDPRYLFMSERHREALAHLLYGVNGGGGFVLLSGEIGAGKTTVCRCFLEQIPRRCNVAYIFNPKLTVTELLKSICDEFRIPHAHQGPGVATVKDYLDPLNEFLLKTHAVGQNSVLIIDEAQNLSPDVLEQLRLLTNLETSERKLLQIILIGQPELRQMLARPELEQLAQRVIARYHLEALSEDETAHYVRHRLAVAGLKRELPFDRAALRRIHRLSRGVPRRINLLCDRAMLGAYASGKAHIGRAVVDRAAREVFDAGDPVRRSWPFNRAATLGLGVAGGAALAGVAGGLIAFSGLWPAPGADGAAVAAAAVTSAASATEDAATTAAPMSISPAQLRGRFAADQRSEPDAWRELAAAWQLPPADGDPCEAAPREQVHCFRTSTASLGLIRQLARPGVVTLYDDAGRPVHALLTALDDDGVTLKVGPVTRTVSLASLARLWRGEFATFWRAPPGYASAVGGGEGGPVAGWVTAQLATLPGAVLAEAPLKARVHAFQVAHGLKPDGLAGPITLMVLNRATGVDEPRLEGGR